MKTGLRDQPAAADQAAGWTKVCVCLLLGTHAGLLAWGAAAHSPTVDEPRHLVAGLRYLSEKQFDLDRGNPPLADLVGALPVAFMTPHLDWSSAPGSRAVVRDFVKHNGMRLQSLFTVGRWACIPMSLVGALACYGWARELYGRASGLLALTLWCFCPNIIGHGQLITSDVSATAMGLLAHFSFWRWLRRPTAERAALAGLALGLAELSKYVWVTLYFLYPTIWLAWKGTTRTLFPREELIHGFLILFLSINVINAGYFFEEPFPQLGSFHLGRKALAWGENRRPKFATRVLKEWIAAIPLPFPANYVRGMDEIDSHYETSTRKSYLRGEWKMEGWWYYYLYGLAIKVPMGTWLLVGLSGAMSLDGRRGSARLMDELFLVLIAVEVVSFVTLVTRIHHHVRYVMPVLPLLFVLASKTATAYTHPRRRLAIAATTGLIWSVGSSLAIYPHSISYFNELVGGPGRGHEHLLDSNIDWGQDLPFVKRWIDANPQARPLYLGIHGPSDPSNSGIDYRPALPPGKDGSPTLEPGWYILSVHRIHMPGYGYFLRRRPDATIAYSNYVYHIDGRLQLDGGERDGPRAEP